MSSVESKALASLYAKIRGQLGPKPDPVFGMRTLLDTLGELAAEPENVRYASVDAGGVDALWCLPDSAIGGRVILYTHGGGLVGGSISSHRKLAAHLAAASGARALIYNFRRAPEHPYPAQLEDATTVYEWLIANGLEAGQIALAGDSIGGALSIWLALKLRDTGATPPAAIVGISPWIDMAATGASYEANAENDMILSKDMLAGMSAMIFGGSDNARPDALNADLAGLSPLFLTAGSAELSVDDSRLFAERAEAAGVPVTVSIVQDMQHVFPFMAGNAPEADQTIQTIATFLIDRFDSNAEGA